jgi:hypothetical protein
MKRSNNTLTVLALLAACTVVQTAAGQMPQLQFAANAQPTPAPFPEQMAPSNANSDPNAPLLTGLPKVPDVPSSLMQPGPSRLYSCDVPECPYFQQDARLDPPGLGQPGWLADIEADVTHVHVNDRLDSFVGTSEVSVPMATLQWTVSPRVEVGYRLPDAFGEFDFSYRFMFANGTGSFNGLPTAPDGPAALTSLFRLNSGDLDYASNESSLWPNWNMKWRVGLRAADLLFSSTADESLVDAAAGSDIYERAVRNEFWGLGPHAALELKRPFSETGLSLAARLDGAIIFGTVRQRFSEVSTNAGLTGQTEFSNAEQVPTLSGFLGLQYRPPQHTNVDILFGYQGEYWWNVGRLDDPAIYNGTSAGEFGAQSVQFRLELNY